jgi:hypothetical protein
MLLRPDVILVEIFGLQALYIQIYCPDFILKSPISLEALTWGGLRLEYD